MLKGSRWHDRTLQKTPVKKAKKGKKRKTTTSTPEGAVVPSPAKLYKPNTLDEAISAHYLVMLPFYTTWMFYRNIASESR